MKNNISIFKQCANCGACYNICPVDAISVKLDDIYYKPVVDESRCIHCGKCVDICPVNKPADCQNLLKACGGYYKDETVVSSSSSGGAFHALAEKILERNGIIFGTVYSENCHEVIFSNTDKVDLIKIQKSKYVESQVGLSFRSVKREVKSGRAVLFCGTPCQVSGLKRFMGQEYPNLYTCDFSCGGLPSHKFYDDYLCFLEKKYGAKVTLVDFRPKTYGWGAHAILVKFQNSKFYSRLATLDPYFQAFIGKRMSMRDYCYECRFSDHHASDIILADFWKYKDLSEFEKNEKGLSLLIANSEKGVSMLKSIEDRFIMKRLDLNAASYNIRPTIKDCNLYQNHLEFIESLREFGYSATVKKWLKINLKLKIKQEIKTIIKRPRRSI